MKYTPLTYANALKSVLREGDGDLSDVLINFNRVVDKNGDQALKSKIVEALEDLLTQEAGGSVVTIESAREFDNNISASLSNSFSDHDLLRYKINPLLVAGTRIMINNSLELDYSLSKRLDQIFRT